MEIAPSLPRFDTLNVVLADQIQQPLLWQLASKLQSPILQNLRASANPSEITKSAILKNQILAKLSQTAIADASILVAITNEACPRLLLTRRADHLKIHAGEVSCAGGKFETGDGNNIVTALREAFEETALLPSNVKLIGQLPPQFSKSGLSVRPIVALIDPKVTLIPEAGEISRIFWADLAMLIDQPITEFRIRYPVQGSMTTIITPSFLVAGETVWGLTGRVIASLLELGFDRKLDWYYRLESPC